MKRFNLKVLFVFLIFIELIMTFQVKSNAINSKYSLGSNIVDDNYIMYAKELEKGSTILANSTITTTSSTSGISIVLFIIAIVVVIELVVIFIRANGLEGNKKRGKNNKI